MERPIRITKKYYKEATGEDPEDDDLERCNCPLFGMYGHELCGWCDDCNKPRFMCGHKFSSESLKSYSGPVGDISGPSFNDNGDYDGDTGVVIDANNPDTKLPIIPNLEIIWWKDVVGWGVNSPP